MGYDPHAATVIGIKFKCSEIIKKSTVKAYPHDYPETMKFCPQTGKKLWDVEFSLIDGTEPHEAMLGGLDVKFANPESRIDNPDEDIFVGIASEAGVNDSKFLAGQNFEEYKKKVQEVLEPLGLWKESRFGIYTFLTGG